MVKRSILQLYRTTIFLAQQWMAASNHLINKFDQKLRQVKNQMIKHQIQRKNKSNKSINKFDQKIRQVKNQMMKHQIRRKNKSTRLVKFLSCLYLASSKYRTHYSIALKFSPVHLQRWLKRWPKRCLFSFLIICRSLGI